MTLKGKQMKYRRLGPDGPTVSVIGFGSWITGGENWGPVRESESLAALEEALAQGVTLIDTAPSYGSGRSERCIAKAIRGRRGDLVLATKCGLHKVLSQHVVSLRPADIRSDLEDSLRRLGVDTVDLYQCHWPDPETPIEETMEALARLQEEGKIRWIGLSNAGRELLDRALTVAPVISVQSQYSVLERTLEASVLPWCRSAGLGVMAYGSLAGGVLSGKYTEQPHIPRGDARSFFYRYYREPEWIRVRVVIDCLRDIAARRDKPVAQVALNWVLAQPGVTVALAGMRTAAQALVNCGAPDWELTDEELRCISAAQGAVVKEANEKRD